MKGVKGKFLKKLKSIGPVGALKQPKILQISALKGFLDPTSSPSDANRKRHSSFISREQDQEFVNYTASSMKEEFTDMVDVTELMKDLEEEEVIVFGDDEEDDKENIGPSIMEVKDPSLVEKKPTLPLSELSASSYQKSKASYHQYFRRPDLNSTTLFDPNLLAAFEQARMEHILAIEAVRETRIQEKKLQRPLKSRRVEEDHWSEFQEKCPPGGSESVILYTTSLRGIRKTFEDCQKIRFLLDSFRILFCERDVSMHLEFREEMWRLLGARVVPPKLFIKGRYIGGADVVLGLHEQGKLLRLLEGLPRDESTNPCQGCGGIRFVLCFNCNGGQKIRAGEGDDALSIQCPQCNENGLIICPMCR